MTRRTALATVLLLLTATPRVSAGWDEGVAAYRSQDFETAIQEFSQLVDQNPDAAAAHYMLGLSLQGAGRVADAVSRLRTAHDLDPEDLAIRLSLGRSLTAVARYPEAVDLLGTIDGNQLPVPQQIAFLRLRVSVLTKVGEPERALPDLRQLAALQPDDAAAQSAFGAAALAAGDLDGALFALARASELAPDDQDKRRSHVKALIRAGRLAGDRGAKRSHYLQAAERAAELVAQGGSHGDHILETSANLGAGRYEEAAAGARRAIEQKPGDWLAHYYLGQALNGNERYADATGVLSTAAKLASRPDDQRLVWAQLGFAYEKQRLYEQAIEVYREAGDSTAVARVETNAQVARENEAIEAENRAIEEVRREAEKLEEELRELEQGPN